jgi:hypothetical protein
MQPICCVLLHPLRHVGSMLFENWDKACISGKLVNCWFSFTLPAKICVDLNPGSPSFSVVLCFFRRLLSSGLPTLWLFSWFWLSFFSHVPFLFSDHEKRCLCFSISFTLVILDCCFFSSCVCFVLLENWYKAFLALWKMPVPSLNVYLIFRGIFLSNFEHLFGQLLSE